MKFIVLFFVLLSSLSSWADFEANFRQPLNLLRPKIDTVRGQFPTTWNTADRDAYFAALEREIPELRTMYVTAYAPAGVVLTPEQRTTLETQFNEFVARARTLEGPALDAAFRDFTPNAQLRPGGNPVATTVTAATTTADAAVTTTEESDTSEECGPDQVPGSSPCRCVTEGHININGVCRPRAECRPPAVIVDNAERITCECQGTGNQFNAQRVCGPGTSATTTTTAGATGSQESLADTYASYNPDSCQWATDLPRKIHSTHSGCNRNGTTSICVGYVVCNVRSGQGQFVRTATCGADKCGANEAKDCVKDRSAFSRKPDDVPTKYMSDRVRSLILAQ